MSEYWKSTPKYWCKHCKTFVVDTKFAKGQHDATGKHQGALKRFLRDLHRNNEREKTAGEAAKREVERLNALTSGSGGSSASSKPVAGTVETLGISTKWATSGVRQLSEAEQKAQLKQLESLGVALPEEFRKEVALPGEWVSTGNDGDTGAGGSTRGKLSSKGKQAEVDSKEAVKEELLRKRKAEEEAKKWEEMDEDERALKSFKVETKTYPGDGFGLEGGDDELGALLGKRKAKGMKIGEEGPVVKKEEGGGARAQQTVADDGTMIKNEEVDGSTALEPTLVKKEEEAAAAGEQRKLGEGIAFKRRKVGNLRKK